jgi:hypothetical protein
MKIDFTSVLLGIDKKPLTAREDPNNKEEKPIILKGIAINALLAEDIDESGNRKSLNAEERVHRFGLAQKISKASDGKQHVDLVMEDVVLIKRLIGANYGTLIVGASFELLPK